MEVESELNIPESSPAILGGCLEIIMFVLFDVHFQL